MRRRLLAVLAGLVIAGAAVAALATGVVHAGLLSLAGHLRRERWGSVGVLLG